MIIALHGAKQSGKDTFFKCLKEEYPDLPIKKIAFADYLKLELMNIFQLKDESEYDSFKMSELHSCLGYPHLAKTIDGRHVVREIGMMIRRLVPNIYNDIVKKKILAEPETIWIVTDLRFGDEVSLIQELGGIILKISRPGFEFDGHITETELDDKYFDFVIPNTTLPEYREYIKSWFDQELVFDSL